MIDEEARRRIREDLGTTFVVEAAAGTGKTTALVSRIVHAIRTGHTTLGRIVAVTFTEKAAGEMKLRVREQLEVVRARSSGEERERLDHALRELETARIGTIHGFCADLLRERPIEARVDPAFEMLDEESGDGVLRRVFDRLLDQWLVDPPDGVRRFLRRRMREGDAHREILFGAVKALIERRDFDAEWKRPAFERKERIDTLVAAVLEIASRARGARVQDWQLRLSLEAFDRLANELVHRERDAPRDYELVEGLFSSFVRDHNAFRGTGRGADLQRGVSREAFLMLRSHFEDALRAFTQDADADLAAALRTELSEVVREYERRKRRAGTLDFLDLLLLARDLLRRDARVLRSYRDSFDCFFVDEFQDVDPVQAEILLTLAAREGGALAPGKLFLVGDPKQSIYRFRRADVAFYEGLKRDLSRAGAEVLYLRTSFRSRPAIQRLVNHTFARCMDGRDGQASYVPLEAFREEGEGFAVVALPVPAPYGKSGAVTKEAVSQSCPDAVGAFVEMLLARGLTVEEGGQKVPLSSRHVCLLFRRLQSAWDDPVHPYVKALEARGIPHVLASGASFRKREEIAAFMTALLAIEWPDDELAVYATLRGPFLSLSDRELLAYKHAVGTLHPLAPRKEDPSEEYAAVVPALDLLARLHRRRNRRPIESTLSDLLEATRAHAAIAIWPTGEQALANVLRVVDYARRLEARGATSFRAFVEWLDEHLDKAGRETPVLEEGVDGVRFLTVHAAKGLEFPVVVLCDPGVPRTSDRPSRWVDASQSLCAMPLAGCAPLDLVEHKAEVIAHDLAEEERLTYVAATRAKDVLVIPVVGDERLAGWVEVFHDSLYPPRDRRRTPEPSGLVFGNDSVVERHPDSRRTREDSVAPGVHLVDGTPIVFWDPHTLRLGVPPENGLLQQDLLAKGPAEAETERKHDAWLARRAKAVEEGARIERAVRTVTEIAHGVDASTLEPVPVERALRGARPGGKRFGTLVHAALELVPYDHATREDVAAVCAHFGRELGAPELEIEAAVETVLGALDHPLMRRAALADARGACHRELPVTFLDEGGTLVEGVVDLAFEEEREGGKHIVLVDFKTDLEPGEQEAYRAQLALYARALSSAMGAPVDALLFAV